MVVNALQTKAGYLVLIRLCRHTMPNTMDFVVSGVWYRVIKRSKAVGKDAIFNDASCPRQMIVENSLIVCQIVAGVGLQQPLPQWEGVIADHEVLYGCVITEKCCGRWNAKGPVLQAHP